MPQPNKAQVYMGGDDPAIAAKRQQYEQALERLSKSLETRQQRMFDPRLLNVAMAFLSPEKPGSFWDALAPAAAGYNKGQATLAAEEEAIARAQMEAASTGLDIERQKQADAQLAQYLGGAQTAAPLALQTPPTAGAEPSAPLSAGVLPTAQQAPGPLSAQYGVRIMPPNPNRMTGRQFIELNRWTMPPLELLMKAQEIDQKNLIVTDAFAFDEATGIMYPAPKENLLERQIPDLKQPGKFKSVKLTAQEAYQLDALRSARHPAYLDYVEQLETIPERAAKPDLTKKDTSQLLAPQGAGATQNVAGGLPSISESAAAAKAEETRVVGRETAALKTEESLPAKTEAAQRAFHAAAEIENLAKKTPTAFGRLKQSGLIPGILNLVSQGVQTPGGSISIKQLDEFVVQTTGEEGDLVVRQRAARSFAELMLAFRRQYFAGYGGGAITEGEQRLANNLASAVEDDPRAIVSIMALIKARSQYDLDENRNWIKFKRENKKANYTDFTESDEYLERQDRYNRRIGKMFGIEAAIPTEQKAQSATGRTGTTLAKPIKGRHTPEQIKAARDKLRGVGG